jgi:hypothetical protein
MPSPFPDKDYVSPGLSVVVPDAHFPRMRALDRWNHPWKHLRREVPHRWYADERFPLMGFLSRDEAAILYNVALGFAGSPGLEIGSWLGWSTCHLALAGVRLDVIDPAHADPGIRAIVDQSLASCGLSGLVHLAGGRSPEGVHQLAARRRSATSTPVYRTPAGTARSSFTIWPRPRLPPGFASCSATASTCSSIRPHRSWRSPGADA